MTLVGSSNIVGMRKRHFNGRERRNRERGSVLRSKGTTIRGIGKVKEKTGGVSSPHGKRMVIAVVAFVLVVVVAVVVVTSSIVRFVERFRTSVRRERCRVRGRKGGN